MENDPISLGGRMKLYEQQSAKMDMCNDCVTMIRLDGNAFHTWTRKAKLRRPFDYRFIRTMQRVTKSLCEEIPNCVIGYTQSDEISLIMKRGDGESPQYWFENRIQKLCSVSASMSAAFFARYIGEYRKINSSVPAFFDARVMFMPDVDECVNCLIWRQNDGIRNSISSMAQSMFSNKELLNKNSDEQKSMMLEKGADWSKLPNFIRMGTMVHKRKEPRIFEGRKFYRGLFYIDLKTPRLSENKQYVIDAYNFKVEGALNEQETSVSISDSDCSSDLAAVHNGSKRKQEDLQAESESYESSNQIS